MFIPLHDKNALETIRLQYVTLGLIGLNILIWFVTASAQLQGESAVAAIYYSWGFVPSVVHDIAELPADLAIIPENASYLTYSFLHGDFMHLAGNMLFLWVFGDNVEDAMGHFRFLVFYLLSAAAAAFAHGFLVPSSEIPLVGASGAVAGVIGAYLMLHPKVKVWILAFGKIPLRLSALWVLTAWIGFQIFSFFANSESEVSWAAHIGGFVSGVVLILVFKKRGVPLFDADVPATQAATAAVSPKEPENKQPHEKIEWRR